MRNYFIAVDYAFKILGPNCWNSFLTPLYSGYPIDLIL